MEQQIACTRAIAADPSVTLDDNSSIKRFALAHLEVDTSNIVANTSVTNTALKSALERGCNDATALAAQFHDAELHQLRKPQGVIAARLFDEMERARYQAAGIGWMLGVSINLEALWDYRNTYIRYNDSNQTEQLALVFSYLTRHTLGLPCQLTEHTSQIVDHWRESIFAAASDSWAGLAKFKKDQLKFASTALDIISRINEDTSADSIQSTNTETVSAKEDKKEDSNEQSTEESNESEDSTEDPDDLTGNTENRDDDKDHSETLLTDENNSLFEEDNTRNRDEAVDAESESYGAALEVAPSPYKSYNTSYDEVVSANKLYTEEDRDALRDTLDEHIERHSRIVGKLAGQLQRLLMANQNRHWKFDLEEGLLDSSRLTRIITQPYSGLSFKQESDLEFKDTVVTLLVDNSKSMLGKPIAIAASCADILSQTLERCGISVEILGFTTTELHGGPLFNQWKADGKTTDPGRLNGLRHIIYKSADMPYRRARSGFGLMLHKDLLKQNIDGEALLWATERLQRRPEERKILLVISDGAPIDTSTMSANRENYLIDHLHKVIDSIESNSKIELAAIGIGHDVTSYYERAITIRDAKDLGKTLLTQFRSLFTPDSSAAM